MTPDVVPGKVFEMVAEDVPSELRPNLLIAGSLAAAYHHRDRLRSGLIRTKDADVVVQPAGAIPQCQDIAQRLLDAGWTPDKDKCWARPTREPIDDLRLIRLNPPEPWPERYFLELIGMPASGQKERKLWVPFQLRDGWYCLPCFRYMSLLIEDVRMSQVEIAYASPAMMALANLLSHPEVGTVVIEGTDVLRSAKDLGRAVALYWLAPPGEPIAVWPNLWWKALSTHFPNEAGDLARQAGAGLTEMLDRAEVVRQAYELLQVGLLAGMGMTREQFEIAGNRLLGDITLPLREAASTAAGAQFNPA